MRKDASAVGRTKDGLTEWFLPRHCWCNENQGKEGSEKLVWELAMCWRTAFCCGTKKRLRTFAEKKKSKIVQTYCLKNCRLCDRQPLIWNFYLLFLTLIHIIRTDLDLYINCPLWRCSEWTEVIQIKFDSNFEYQCLAKILTRRPWSMWNKIIQYWTRIY